jgi:luciferase family oxidoreductase group 1
MLPHYAALKVAEQFRVLEAIAPGRIDMGLGRAPGSDGLTAHALNPNAAQAADNFPADVRDLLAWLAGEPLVERHPFRSITAQPQGPTVPEPWILGSSSYGAQVAAHFGLPHCFAWFISDGHGAAEAMDIYRTGYRPSERFPTPMGAVCVWAITADTHEEAERLFSSRALARIWRDRGVFAPLPSPEEAAAYNYSNAEKLKLERLRAESLWGTPDVVASKLRTLAAELQVEDVVVLSTAHDPEVRRRSYTLLMQEMRQQPKLAAE